MPAVASLRALLSRSIDYAGMFPPCSLELAVTLKNQAEYVRSLDSWMLSAFVLPIAKFDDATKLVSQFDKHHPLRISALAAKTNNAKEFWDEFKNAIEKINLLQRDHLDLASVIQLEILLPSDVDSASLNQAAELLGPLKLQVFF